LSLQAGVAYTGNRSDINKDLDSRSGAVNGAHSDQSNITLDGVDVNDETRGYAFTSVLPVSLDSVQEFRVTTTNYNADSGRSSGAQISLVTKSGTNDLHGSLYEYHRNTFTSANDYFVKQSELQSGEPNEAPKLIRNIFGASLGGPDLEESLVFLRQLRGLPPSRTKQRCPHRSQRRHARRHHAISVQRSDCLPRRQRARPERRFLLPLLPETWRSPRLSCSHWIHSISAPILS